MAGIEEVRARIRNRRTGCRLQGLTNPDTGKISHFTTPRVPDAPSSAHAGPSLEGKLAAVTWGFTVLRQMEDRRTLWMTTALQSNSGALSGWALNAGPNSCIVVLRRLSP